MTLAVRVPIACTPGLRFLLAIAIALFLAFSISSNSAFAQSHLRTIALSGQQAPGFLPGAVFQPGEFSFTNAVINNAGTVAFAANVTIEEGVISAAYTAVGENVRLLAQSGQSLPGVPVGETITRIGVSNLGEDNSVLFTGETESRRFQGYWRERNHQTDLVVGFPGVEPPGTVAGSEFTDLDSLRFDNGIAFFYGLYKQPSGTTHGNIWMFSDTLRNVVGYSVPLPGSTDDRRIVSIDSDSLYLNGHGKMAFHARHRIAGGPAFDGIFIGTPDLMKMVISAGDQVPGTQDRFGNVGRFRLNDAEQFAFTAITSAGQTGIWSNGRGSFAPVIIEDTHVADLPEGVRIDQTFGLGLLINGKGDVSFLGTLAGSGVTARNDEAVFSEGLGGLHLVAREGDQIADMGLGATIEILTNRTFSTNALGQTAFFASFTNPITQKAGIAVFAEDLSGSLRVIAAQHHSLEVSPGDIRTIRNLGIRGAGGGEDGQPNFFNDSGQVVFVADFTDGSSGTFVSNLVAIPEPSSIVFAILGLAASVAVYRRRHMRTGR